MVKGNSSNPMMIVLIGVIAIVGIYALSGGFGGTGNDNGVDNGSSSGSNDISSYEIVDDVAFTVKDRTSTLNSTHNLEFYLTPHGQYKDINAAFAAVQDSEVVSPFAGEEYSSAQVIADDNTVTFTLAANNGQVKYYDIICIDTDIGVGDDYINTIETVGIRGKETADGTESLQIVSDSETTITAFKQIKLNLRGDISVLNDGNAASSYTIAIDEGADETNKVKTFTVGVLGEYTTANDITIYVEEIDNVGGVCDVVLNDVTINGKNVGFSEVTTTNFESRSAIWKNKPSIDTNGTLHVLEGMFTLSKEAEDNTAKEVTINIGIDYDVDVSAESTDDAGAIKITFVSFNGDVDSEQETETFTFNLIEGSVSSGYDV